MQLEDGNLQSYTEEKKHLKVRYDTYHFNDVLCSVFYRNIKVRGSCTTEARWGKTFKENH